MARYGDNAGSAASQVGESLGQCQNGCLVRADVRQGSTSAASCNEYFTGQEDLILLPSHSKLSSFSRYSRAAPPAMFKSCNTQTILITRVWSLHPMLTRLKNITRATSAAPPDDPAQDDNDSTTVRERLLIAKEEKAKPQQPPLYAVILLNDNYTPREFVTRILKKHFGLDGDSAETIMMHAHRYGEARVGAWQKDVAETKMHNAEEEASEAGHPLQFRCHPVEP